MCRMGRICLSLCRCPVQPSAANFCLKGRSKNHRLEPTREAVRVRAEHRSNNSSSLTEREVQKYLLLACSMCSHWATQSMHPTRFLGGGCFSRFSRLFSAPVGIETPFPINLLQNTHIQKHSASKSSLSFLSFFFPFFFPFGL